MSQPTSRRDWLKITAALTAGLSFSRNSIAGNLHLQTPNPGSMILLNSNENAYGPSANTLKAMTEAAQLSNRYPDDIIPLLKKEVAAHWKVGSECILFGAGSSEILGLTAILSSKGKKNMVTPFPTFASWFKVAELMGCTLKKNEVNPADKSIDLNALLKAIDAETGMVEQLPSLADMAISNKNIVVAKTFSKIYGLAGARIGYAIAHPDTITQLGILQPWPNVSISSVTAMAAMAALKDEAFVNDCRTKNKAAREMCYKHFTDMKLEYIPSAASFILFNINSIGDRYTKEMQGKNIFVQYRDFWNGKWSRVSMGTLEEMKMYCDALKSIA